MAEVVWAQYPQRRPNGLIRGSSATVIGLTTTISKVFLNGFNSLETVGLENFLKVLKERDNPFERQRGLLTGMYFHPLLPTGLHHVPY